MKRIAILGSTGSIGRSTLRVAESYPDRFQIIALAARNSIPAIYEFRDFAVLGGLASYGNSLNDALRQAAVYTGKILGGAEPTDIGACKDTYERLRPSTAQQVLRFHRMQQTATPPAA